MESQSKSFPTLRGYCHIYTDKLVLEEYGLGGKMRLFLTRKGIVSVGFAYALAAIALILGTLVGLWLQNYFLSLFLLGALGFNLYLWWSNRRHAFAMEIPRSEINSVSLEEAVEGVSRARFVVHFQKGRRVFKRFIYFPRKLKEQQMIVQSALYMLKEEGLLTR